MADCLTARKDFTPFVVSVDGVLEKEAKMLLKQLERHLARRWDQSASNIMTYINSKMSSQILKATDQCLQGSFISLNWEGCGIGEDGASLGLFRSSEL